MQFHTYEEAFDYLQKYEILNNLFYEPLNKQIRNAFIGISDPVISKAIYLGLYDIFPRHHFTKNDLQNIEFWAAFYPTKEMNDSEIINLTEVFENEPLFLDYVNKGKIEASTIVASTNNELIKIPRGLGIKIVVKGDSEVNFEITDPITFRKSSGVIVNPSQREYKFISYLDYSFELSNMVNPHIKFSLVDNNAAPVEISLEFLDR